MATREEILASLPDDALLEYQLALTSATVLFLMIDDAEMICVIKVILKAIFHEQRRREIEHERHPITQH